MHLWNIENCIPTAKQEEFQDKQENNDTIVICNITYQGKELNLQREGCAERYQQLLDY